MALAAVGPCALPLAAAVFTTVVTLASRVCSGFVGGAVTDRWGDWRWLFERSLVLAAPMAPLMAAAAPISYRSAPNLVDFVIMASFLSVMGPPALLLAASLLDALRNGAASFQLMGFSMAYILAGGMTAPLVAMILWPLCRSLDRRFGG
jgi:hypothetical protein